MIVRLWEVDGQMSASHGRKKLDFGKVTIALQVALKDATHSLTLPSTLSTFLNYHLFSFV